MATKGKITRLGDPNNPYTKKNVVVASAATMKPGVAPKKTTVVAKVAPPPRNPVVRARNFVSGVIDEVLDAGRTKLKRANTEYNDVRRRKIDEAVDGKPRK